MLHPRLPGFVEDSMLFNARSFFDSLDSLFRRVSFLLFLLFSFAFLINLDHRYFIFIHLHSFFKHFFVFFSSILFTLCSFFQIFLSFCQFYPHFAFTIQVFCISMSLFRSLCSQFLCSACTQ